MDIEIKSSNKSFGGIQQVIEHPSRCTGTPMKVAIYAPPTGSANAPVVFFLSGLTCTEQNVTTKSGLQAWASELGLVVVCPDTSPRGDDVADDEGWDMGKGAGFYVDATQDPWKEHYQMESYVADELFEVVGHHLGRELKTVGLMGHSMGGHGALVLGMRHPERFSSISAFSPICAPTKVPWGHKAFGGYLGDDREAWKAHDASELVRSRGWKGDILVDQGLDDSFLTEQLKPEELEAACQEAGVPLTLRQHEGYDHSYYFIATFMRDHLRWHAERS